MKRAYRVFGFFIGVIATVAFTVYAFRMISVEDFQRYAMTTVIAWMTITIFIYVTIIPIGSWAWREMLSSVGVSVSWSELAMIMAVTQMAKYLPGNIAQHIGRTTMSLTRGIGVQPYVSTVLAETLLTILAALVVGLFSAVFSGVDLGAFRYINISAFTFFLIALLILFIFSKRALISRLIQRFSTSSVGQGFDTLLPQPTALFKAFSAYCLNYMVVGIVLWLLAVVLLPGMEHDYMLLLCSFSLVWLIGFLTPGSPAGLGIREIFLLGLLGITYDDTDGIFLVVSLRIVTTLGDGLCFFAGYMTLLFGRFVSNEDLKK